MHLVTRNWQAKPLGMYLVEAGILTSNQVEAALYEQQKSGRRLGEILVTRGWVEQQTIEYLIEKVVLPERTQPYPNENSSQKLNAFEQVSQAERRKWILPTF